MWDQTLHAMLYGVCAGGGFAFALGTWRRGWGFGLVCGFAAAAAIWLMLLPFWFPFHGVRRLI